MVPAYLPEMLEVEVVIIYDVLSNNFQEETTCEFSFAIRPGFLFSGPCGETKLIAKFL